MPNNARAEGSPYKQNLPYALLKRGGRWLWISLERGLSAFFEACRRFGDERHLLFAAAISYYGIISLVPLVAIGLTVCGWFIKTEAAGITVSHALSNLFPITPESLLEAVRRVSATSTWAFVLYLGGLVWAGAYLFESIERVVNAICGDASDRAFIHRKFIAIAAVMGAGLLLLSSVILGAVWAAFRRVVDLPTTQIAFTHWLIGKIGILLPLVTSTLVFALVYKLLPTRRIPWKSALSGGIFAGLLWEFSKWGFGIFVVLSGRNYGSLYGSLANLVLIMLWIHLSALILIIGAHISRIVRERMERAAALTKARQSVETIP